MARLAAALGFFDGVHKGHSALLARVCSEAEKRGLTPAVITLDRYPAAAVGGFSAPLINSAADREALIKDLHGIETVHMLRFDAEMIATEWRDYAARLICEFGCELFVCGYDHRFGARGEGTAEKLAAFARENGAECIIIPPVTDEKGIISSTAIRTALREGDLRTANAMLGHPHTISGTVCGGQKLGRTLGFPTANITLPSGTVCPAFGVYAVRCTADGREYDGVMNIGTKPTVTTLDDVTLETYIIGWSGDLYGKKLTVRLHERLRPEQKFANVEALAAQMRIDAENAQNFLKTLRKCD